MRVPFTQKTLEDWAGDQVFRDGMKLWERGAVIHADFDPPTLQGTLEIGSRRLRSALDVLPDGTAENRCPCHTSRERGLVCVHVVALGLELVRRAHDPRRREKLEAERRKAARLAAQEEGGFLRRVPPDTPGAVPLRLAPVLPMHWPARYREHGTVPVRFEAESGRGRGGIGELDLGPAYSLSPADEAVLYVLEDICEGPVPTRIDFRPGDFLNLLDLYRGRTLDAEGGQTPVMVNAAALASHLLADLDRDTGEVIVMVRTELPYMPAAEIPEYIVTPAAGWAYGAGNFWPLESVLPGPLQSVYRDPITVPRPAVPRFLETELPLLARQVTVETDLSADLLTVDPEPPRPTRRTASTGCASWNATASAASWPTRWAWARPADPGLAAARAQPTRARGKPALIVCPTSLVENWAEEAARFTPGLRVLTLSGADRHERWEASRLDLVVTSYALLRRDIERYLAIEFAAVVLDEAQHIKNRSTQNAQAAKQLRAATGSCSPARPWRTACRTSGRSWTS
jgi:hypothetical protein